MTHANWQSPSPGSRNLRDNTSTPLAVMLHLRHDSAIITHN